MNNPNEAKGESPQSKVTDLRRYILQLSILIAKGGKQKKKEKGN